jgi:flagellar biogenesis protein FliO
VGFNPFREHNNSAADIAAMVVALIAILAVVAWAIFSG